jgi:protein phosphatase
VAGDAAIGFAVLADGMGGHNAGEVASRMALELVTDRIRTRTAEEQPLDAAHAEASIVAHVAAANSAVLQAARTHPQFRGMGTTLIVVLWHEDGVSYGHVGDSRLYLLRNNVLEQLTRDHSIVQEQLDRGVLTRAQARYSVNRNVLTRAVGIDPQVLPDIHTRPTNPGDVFLLCSDGLTDMLTDDEIRGVLLSATNADSTARRLVELANAAGGHDNISVILARVVSAPRPFGL